MASSDLFEITNFYWKFEWVEVMTSVKLSNKGTGRVCCFNAVFNRGMQK